MDGIIRYILARHGYRIGIKGTLTIVLHLSMLTWHVLSNSVNRNFENHINRQIVRLRCRCDLA